MRRRIYNENDIFRRAPAESESTLHMVVTIQNDTKVKSYGELNRTETRALSGRYQGVLLL